MKDEKSDKMIQTIKRIHRLKDIKLCEVLSKEGDYTLENFENIAQESSHRPWILKEGEKLNIVSSLENYHDLLKQLENTVNTLFLSRLRDAALEENAKDVDDILHIVITQMSDLASLRGAVDDDDKFCQFVIRRVKSEYPNLFN